MGEKYPKGKISIEHATRRGVNYIDVADRAGHDTEAPSSRRDIVSPGDGVAETVELEHAKRVADLVRGGLDNYRSVSPVPLTETDNS